MGTLGNLGYNVPAKFETILTYNIWGFPKMVGFPNNHGVFLLKLIILGGEVPLFLETPI